MRGARGDCFLPFSLYNFLGARGESLFSITTKGNNI
jgi:hypothetical protein|tara:strand:- start:2324 stop:2431 length:108 start_codon:yes stop_codon:yes gene_type:complete